MWVFTAFLVAAFFHASVSQYFDEDTEERSDAADEELDRSEDEIIVVINDEPEPNDGWVPEAGGPPHAMPPPEYLDLQGPPPFDYA